MDGMRYALGEDAWTRMGLTAAIRGVKMRAHREGTTKRGDSVTRGWWGGL